LLMSEITKVLFVFGTRPETVKLAPVIRLMQSQAGLFDVRLCVTAQHREMLDSLLDFFELEPDYDLNLMQEEQKLSELTGRILEALDGVLEGEKPDWLLVQGDTTTTMAASLAAYHRKIKIAHVEAGLRTDNKYEPFPEEMNRRITGTIADLHFAPTETAKDNLLKEGINGERIFVTGNTVVDALREISGSCDEKVLYSAIPVLSGNRIILVTAHRRENFGTPIRTICHALKKIADSYRNDVQIVYPVHLNPNIRRPVYELLEGHKNIILTGPLDYLSFVGLLKRCNIVLTDSGGLQEEAPSFGKPVLVLRNVTERQEGLQAKVAKLIGTKTEHIYKEVSRLLLDEKAYHEMSLAVNPYGDGHAAERICDILATYERKAAYAC
jgi:UDP-N-acetylglucosamine 2-epimerase (non-hydrolysing)